MKPEALMLAGLAAFFPLTVRAGFADINVQNLRSSAGLQESHQSNVVGRAYTDTNSVDLGTQYHNLDFAHQLGIEITFSDLGETPARGQYTIEWFFVSKDVNTKARRVFDYGAKSPTNARQVIDAISKPVGERQQTSVSTSLAGAMTNPDGSIPVTQTVSHVKAGEKIEGWIVRLTESGRVTKTLTSLPELNDFAEAQADQLDQLEASPQH